MELYPVSVLMDAAGYPSDAVVVAVGISLVFLILLLLTLIISLQGRLFDALNKKRSTAAAAKAPAPAPQPAAVPAPVVEDGIPEEVVAVIAAAVASMDGGKYTLRTLSRAQNGRGAWGDAGVNADTEPF